RSRRAGLRVSRPGIMRPMLPRCVAFVCLSVAWTAVASAQTHFHHVHLNSTDPRAAIEFYTEHLSGEKATFAGADAVWTQSSWLLFHIGWGAEDMKAEF